MSAKPIVRRDFSAEEIALVRSLYEKELAPIAAIAARLGASPGTISKRIKVWRLRRKPARKPPRKPVAGKGAAASHGGASVDLRRTAARLEKRLTREIVALEEKLDAGGEVEREARTLASLVKSLGELRRFASGHAGEPADRNAELAELRAELARRLAQLGASGGDGGAAADADDAAAG